MKHVYLHYCEMYKLKGLQLIQKTIKNYNALVYPELFCAQFERANTCD
jgi:hypothetical protein